MSESRPENCELPLSDLGHKSTCKIINLYSLASMKKKSLRRTSKDLNRFRNCCCINTVKKRTKKKRSGKNLRKHKEKDTTVCLYKETYKAHRKKPENIRTIK